MLNQKGLKLDNLVGMFCNRNEISGQESRVKEFWKKMDENFFIDLSENILNIYKIAKSTTPPLKIEDIHENNMGYRNRELVAFDFI